ncbi:MAG: hypothetical protein AMXMBFR59_10200 [Rhodanobacteraceae bacterium]
MSRQIDHLQAQAGRGKVDDIAADDAVCRSGDALIVRGVHVDGIVRAQLGNAADVIAMMVRNEDGAQLQIEPMQRIDHGARVAGIDNYRAAAVMGQPKIVVVEGRDGLEA